MFNKLICENESGTCFDNLFNFFEQGILLSKAINDDNGEVLDFTILEINKAFEIIFGIKRENIIGKTIKEIFPSIAPKWTDICREMAKSGRNTKSDIHFEIQDRHFKVNVISQGKGHIMTFFTDITDQIKADEVLKKYSLLFQNAHDILLYLKSDGSIIDANKTAVHKYGYSYAELLNMNIQQLRHPSMVVQYKEQMEISVSNGIVFEGIHVRKDGTSFPVEVSSRSIDINGELLRIHIIRDITKRREAEEKINYLANYDALTGIPNRGYLMRQLDNILEHSAENNLKFAVMLFDVDKFKSINDVYGHNVGDEVLRSVAERLQNAVRKLGIVGRLGGDEFLVIQTSVNNIEETAGLADKIINDICRPVKLDNVDIDVHISLGAAIYPEASNNKDGLIHCADTAMYSVKQKGGNSYKVY